MQKGSTIMKCLKSHRQDQELSTFATDAIGVIPIVIKSRIRGRSNGTGKQRSYVNCRASASLNPGARCLLEVHEVRCEVAVDIVALGAPRVDDEDAGDGEEQQQRLPRAAHPRRPRPHRRGSHSALPSRHRPLGR
jgi:hypothetical protein